MAKVANPQGKGGDLLTTHWLPVIKLQKKPEQQITFDYLASMLVLSAEFSFKPVPGTQYFLYLWKGTLRLSLIPFVKKPTGSIDPIAQCELRRDLTWQLDFLSRAQLSPKVIQFIEAFSEKFADHLDKDVTIKETLPFYEAELPFYRRLYAAGLAKSLSLSLQQSRLENKKASRFIQGNLLSDSQKSSIEVTGA